MPSNLRHIQKVCKHGLLIAFLAFPLQFCGGDSQPQVQALLFDDQSVPFQNTSCSTSITLVNNATIQYVLAFMTATFEDESGEKFVFEFDQNEVADIFEPDIIPGGTTSEGNVTFDLQNSNLSPPLTATIVVVGIEGQQVTNFVGNFTCQ